MGKALLLAVIGVMLVPGRALPADDCLQAHAYNEKFTATTYMDPSTSAAGWGTGVVKLPERRNIIGADRVYKPEELFQFDYDVTKGQKKPKKPKDEFLEMTAVDVNGDGLDDLLTLTYNKALPDECAIHYGLNMGFDAAGEFQGWDFGGKEGSPEYMARQLTVPANCNDGAFLQYADPDGDGDADILFIAIEDHNERGYVSAFIVLENRGVNATTRRVDFVEHNRTADLTDAEISWHWFSHAASSIDWDGDKRDDLVIGTSYAHYDAVLLLLSVGPGIGYGPPTALIEGTGVPLVAASVGNPAADNSGCPATPSRGITLVGAADFDGDRDIDLVIGSVSDRWLYLWMNDGTDHFVRRPDILYQEGAPETLALADWDNDGDLDLVIGRNGDKMHKSVDLNEQGAKKTCMKKGGQGWYYENDGHGNFVVNTQPAIGALKTTAKSCDQMCKDEEDVCDEGCPGVCDNPHCNEDCRAAEDECEQECRITCGGNQTCERDCYHLCDDAKHACDNSCLDCDDACALTRRLCEDACDGTCGGSRSCERLCDDVCLNAERVCKGVCDGLGDCETQCEDNCSDTKQECADICEEEEVECKDGCDGDKECEAGCKIANKLKDIDWTVNGDFDGDGKPDLIGGDDKKGAPVYLTLSSSTGTGLYNLEGTAISLEVDTLDERTNLIASAHITSLSVVRSPPDTDVQFYLSNDGGARWEVVVPAELPPGSVPHEFVSFGADLRFRAELSAAPNALNNTAARTTPEIHGISITYSSVEPHRFSRSGLALGEVVVDGQTKEYLYAASFIAPGYEGHITAFDVTSLVAGAASGLTDLDDEELFAWDGGEGLKTRTADSRVLYGGYAAGGSGGIDDRVLISTSSLTSTSPTLKSMMGLTDANATQTIAFLRSGTGAPDGAKLRDIGHSTPVYLGVPNGDAAYMGDDYGAYAAAQSGRRRTVFIGANDGFLRAFDAATGVEMWGYVPNNLLPKLRLQRDASSGSERYVHHYYVDGAVVVQDVHDHSASRWRTVLVAGQALGSGRSDDNYYFALDVTDPANPLPIWEFTDPWDAASTPCTVATTTESPECGGAGAGKKCCEHIVDGRSQGEFFCTPLADACGAPDTVLGETWSPPAFARVKIASDAEWVVFFGSGYNRRGLGFVGRSVYAVRATDGALLGQWDVDEVVPTALGGPGTLVNTIPGGVNVVDTNGDGFVDRVYFGDLEGRLWKIDVSTDATLVAGRIPADTWPKCVLFDAAHQGDGSGARVWAPIITKPAVAVVYDSKPNVYFGTGGDDLAPGDLLYRFYAVHDSDDAGACRASPKHEGDLTIDKYEWIIGNGLTNQKPAVALDPTSAEGQAGDRYWSDPVVVNNRVVYFASLTGKIESINPCSSSAGSSKLFGYAIQPFTGVNGGRLRAGDNVLGAEDPYFDSSTKIRQAVLLRTPTGDAWTRPPQALKAAIDATDVFVQTASGDTPTGQPKIKRLSTLGVSMPTGLRILRWREVPL